jgi:hypothetical protein
MQDLSLVHFENAVPAMADLGLEHLLGPLFQAVFNKKTDALKAALTTEGIRELLQGVAAGSKAKALRRLVVALTTPGAELLAAEGDQTKMKVLLDQQALRPLSAVWEDFAGFFASLGISLPDTQDSSDLSGASSAGDPQAMTDTLPSETAGS